MRKIAEQMVHIIINTFIIIFIWEAVISLYEYITEDRKQVKENEGNKQEEDNSEESSVEASEEYSNKNKFGNKHYIKLK